MTDLLGRLEAAEEGSREVWVAVRGYEQFYLASDLGRIMSLRTGKIIRSKVPDYPGSYPGISLHGPKGRGRRGVHILIADAFLPPKPGPNFEVRHLDGNRGNCAASNLEWGTRKQNAADRERHGRTCRGRTHGMFGRRYFGETNPFAKLTEEGAKAIFEAARQGVTQRKIAAKFGVSQKTVWAIVNGKRWPHIAALKARASKRKE